MRKGFSQAGQDLFVLEILDDKRFGTFLEVGSQDPIALSNTFLLESEYGWTGIGVEISRKFANKYNRVRLSKCIRADATKIDYLELVESYNLPKVIDYLSLDIEPGLNTLKALISIPFDSYKFRVITFEHDFYANKLNNQVRSFSRSILESLGYVLVVEDVMMAGNIFEDWWVNPNYVSKEKIARFKNKEIEGLNVATK